MLKIIIILIIVVGSVQWKRNKKHSRILKEKFQQSTGLAQSGNIVSH